MRLIDADALKELRHDIIQGSIKFDGNEYDMIDKCPTIDAVVVVRCKDCKYCNRSAMFELDNRIGHEYICNAPLRGRGVNSFGFCEIGERREP